MLFLGIMASYVARANTSIAVVAMTDAENTNPDFDEFDWSNSQMQYVLSSFYWGYCLTQFFGGWLCKRYGVKITMFFAINICTVACLVTPVTTRAWSWQGYCGLRVIQGLAQGLIFPCMHEHVAKWAPKQEKNRLGAFANSGLELGTVLALGTSGIIASSDMGWPGISYVAGGLGLIWAVIWIIFASNSPSDSKQISEAERKYILSSQDHDSSNKKPIPTPWRAMLTSVPFIVLVATRCSEAWGFTTMLAEVPQYMHGVLGLDIKSNALFSALPYLIMWLMSYVYIITADIIMKNNCLSLTALRRTYNSIAFYVPAAALIAIGFVNEDQKPIAIALITLNIGVNSAATIGSSLNTIDLAPNHAGMQMAFINTAANIIPIFTPLIVGFIVEDESNREEWQIVFIISAIIFIVGNTVYIIFGSTQMQEWNDPNFLKKDDSENPTPAAITEGDTDKKTDDDVKST
ncbi:hypothetical protein ACFFRR_008002 [Megaselia abdita]